MRHLEGQLLTELIRHGQIMDNACRLLPPPLLLLYLSSKRISKDAIDLSTAIRQLVDDSAKLSACLASRGQGQPIGPFAVASDNK